MSTNTLSHFFSVAGRNGKPVVVRVSRFGSLWAWQAPTKGARPLPAGLLFPACSIDSARVYARGAVALGWPAKIKHGAACAPWRTGPLAGSPPPFAVIVIPPAGINATAAHAALSDHIALDQLSCYAKAAESATAPQPWF
jgi:hypothetical protein